MKIQPIIAAAVMASATGLTAQTIYNWNGNPTGGGTGVNNTWDTTTANWTGAGTTWPSSGTANQAVFGGAAGAVTISGGVTANKLTFNTDGYTVGSSTLSFNGTTPTIDVTTGTTTISSVINSTAGNVGLRKTGAGTLVFSGANSYAGPTSVLGGTLRLDPGAAFNTWALTIDNATMIIQRNVGNTLSNNPVTLSNGGILDANNSSSNFNTIRSLTFNNGGTLQRSGAVNNDGNFALSTLTPSVTDAVTVTGNAAATISAGLGLYNATGVSSRFNVADVTSSAATDLLVTGVLANGGGAFVNGFTKLGAGTMELRAANTYTGATTVQGGRLLVGSGGTVSNSASFNVDGGTLSIATNVGSSLNSKAVTVQNGGVLSMENTTNNWGRIGALTLHNGGTLQTTTTADTNGAFQLAGNVTVTGNTTSTISARIALDADNSGTNRTFDVANGAAAADLLVSGVIVDGNFNLTNNLVKAGAGTMVLSAANTYKGSTVINDGVLRLATGGSFSSSTTLGFRVNDTGSGVLDVENSAFSFNQTISLTLAPVTISNGSWNLFTGSQFGSGDLSLSAVNSDIIGLSFSKTGSVWSGTESGRTWSFDQGTGVLSVIPEPSTYVLIAISLTAFVIFRRRRHAA